MTEHTPGPWTVSWSANEIPGNYLLYQAKAGKCCDARTHDANARLIAAAPDYHAAALLATEDAGPLNADDLSEGIIISEQAYNAIVAALARTTEPNVLR